MKWKKKAELQSAYIIILFGTSHVYIPAIINIKTIIRVS